MNPVNSIPPKDELIQLLKLQPHPKEGGYFKRTYESDRLIPAFDGERHLLTSIYYLLTNDQPRGFLHRNRADIIHYFHMGGPAEYLLVSPEGSVRHEVLGPDITAGQRLQLVVPGGYWKGSRLLSGEYSLLSEAVAPGFDYRDNQLCTRGDLYEMGLEQDEILSWLKA